MTDQMNAAREDLAFLKAVADDRGPLPSFFGLQLMAPGLIYGANLIGMWVALKVLGSIPPYWMMAAWIPGTVIYMPLLALFTIQNRNRPKGGPTLRAIAAAFGAVGAMTVTVVAVVITASVVMQINYAPVWPPLAFALYGGAWLAVGVIRRSRPIILTAVGCFLTAVLCAAVVNRDELWLGMGLGLLAFFTVPGAVIWKTGRA